MSGTCKICGCTRDNACYHPDFGNCWWMDEDEDLCSHCIELKDMPGVVRPSDRELVEISSNDCSIKTRILNGDPFEYTISGTKTELLITKDNWIRNSDYSLVAEIIKISRTGIHWRRWILNTEAKGFIRYKDCKMLAYVEC